MGRIPFPQLPVLVVNAVLKSIGLKGLDPEKTGYSFQRPAKIPHQVFIPDLHKIGITLYCESKRSAFAPIPYIEQGWSYMSHPISTFTIIHGCDNGSRIPDYYQTFDPLL